MERRQLCAVPHGRVGVAAGILAVPSAAPQAACLMSIELWLAFTAATIVLLIIPGPTILLVVSYALGQGWRSALPIALGVALGDFTAMTLSLLGVGALLSSSAAVFTVLKWMGAAYLVYLGVKQIGRASCRERVESSIVGVTV